MKSTALIALTAATASAANIRTRTATCTDVTGWKVDPYQFTCATVVANGLCTNASNNLGFDGTRAPQSCCGCGGGTSAPPPGTLSTANQAQIGALANHYNCHAASGDLVTTINNIIEKNSVETDRLKTECQGFLAAHTTNWANAKTTFETDYAAVVPTENTAEENKITAATSAFDTITGAWCVANFAQTGYEGCYLSYGTEVADFKNAKDTADREAEDAIAAHDAGELDYNAQNTASQQSVKTRRAAVAAQLVTNFNTKDGTYTTAAALLVTTMAATTSTRTTQKATCESLHLARSNHIASDTILLGKMKPLIDQINFCTGSKDTVFLQDDTSKAKLETQAKCASAKNKLSSFLQVGGVSPSGSYHDFVARVAEETKHANLQKQTCDEAADRNFETSKTNAETLKAGSESAADKREFDDNKVLNDGLSDYITSETTRLSTLFTACCDTATTTSLVAIKIEKVGIQTTKTSEFTAKETTARAKLTAAVTAKVIALHDAHAFKTSETSRRHTLVTNAFENKKTEITESAAQQKEYCTDAKQNLVAEADTVSQMKSVLQSGGTSNNGLSVVHDSVTGDAAQAGATDVAFSSHATAANAAFSFVNKLDSLTAAQLECPVGYTNVDDLGADTTGCGLVGCDTATHAASIETCADLCTATTGEHETAACRSFTFAPLNGDINYQGLRVCTIYGSMLLPNVHNGKEGGVEKPMQRGCVRKACHANSVGDTDTFECAQEGTIITNPGITASSCTCTACNSGYSGGRCHIADPCVTSTDSTHTTGNDGNFYCTNGGTIGGTTGACSCSSCAAGYSGSHCQTANDCASSTNAAHTSGNDGNYHCTNGGDIGGTTGACSCSSCDPGFSGTHCETADTCVKSSTSSHNTGNDGNFYCLSGTIGGTTGSCTCSCINNYSGTHCNSSPPPPPAPSGRRRRRRVWRL